MAGLVLKRKFSFQMNICAKMKVSASKSATSPSCETLAVMVGATVLNINIRADNERKMPTLRKIESGVLPSHKPTLKHHI